MPLDHPVCPTSGLLPSFLLDQPSCSFASDMGITIGGRREVPAHRGPPHLQLPGPHLNHLEHLDGRIPEAVLLQEGTYGVYGFLHLSQEMAVRLEEFADELVQVPSWGLVKKSWLWREMGSSQSLAGAGCRGHSRVDLQHPGMMMLPRSPTSPAPTVLPLWLA